MKRKIILLASLLSLSFLSFGQIVVNPAHFDSTSEPVSLIRESYLFMSFKHPNDTTQNITLFLRDIGRIVSMNDAQKSTIRSQLQSALNQQPKKWVTADMLYWLPYLVDNDIPFMGINVNDIILANFAHTQYVDIFNALKAQRIRTNDAYVFLERLCQNVLFQQDGVILGGPDFTPLLHVTYRHHGI